MNFERLAILLSTAVVAIATSFAPAMGADGNGKAGNGKGPTIYAVRVNPRPVIDGKLDDHAWQAASRLSEFYCNQLNRPPSQTTQAWICYDSRSVYVAFQCHDTEPDKIIAKEIQRGAQFEKDDYVQVTLDTTNQRRWDDAYRFQVTALGTQAERIPGGSASKVEWRGDWIAAVKRVADGWIAEMEIPLANLRYPSGQKSWGIFFGRHVARERELSLCPDLGAGWDMERAIEWSGLELPFFKPPLLVMPYTLALAGRDRTGFTMGMDMKQRFNNGLTSTLSIKPDFRNIENQILDLAFSYTERFVEERRPFFVEGEDYFPDRNVFYTPRIDTNLDVGFKTFGKLGNTRLGILQAGRLGQRSDTVLNVQQDITNRWRIGTAYIRRSDLGGDNNTFGIRSNYFRPMKNGGFFTYGSLYGTTTSGEGGEGTSKEFNFIRWMSPGGVGWRIRYEDISEAYDPKDGFVPEPDRKGFTGDLNYYLQPKKGWIEQLRSRLGFGLYDHHSGGFFHSDLNFDGGIDIRKSVGMDLGYTRSWRPPHQDQVFLMGLRWNRLSLYESGAVGVSFGRRASAEYRVISLNKGIRITRNMSILLTSQFGRIPDENSVSRSTQQHIVSLNYDLTNEKGIGGRFVKNARGTNMYVSYRQAVRRGMDLFFIVGDPNADRFSPGIALKSVVVLGR